MKIRTVTDPLELAQVMLDKIREGNARIRERIKDARVCLKGGVEEEVRLKAEIKALNGRKKASK